MSAKNDVRVTSYFVILAVIRFCGKRFQLYVGYFFLIKLSRTKPATKLLSRIFFNSLLVDNQSKRKCQWYKFWRSNLKYWKSIGQSRTVVTRLMWPFWYKHFHITSKLWASRCSRKTFFLTEMLGRTTPAHQRFFATRCRIDARRAPAILVTIFVIDVEGNR